MKQPMKPIAVAECKGGLWMVPQKGVRQAARLYADGVRLGADLVVERLTPWYVNMITTHLYPPSGEADANLH